MNKVNCYCKYVILACLPLKYKLKDLPIQSLIYLSLPDELKNLYFMFNSQKLLYSKDVDYVQTLIIKSNLPLDNFECENIHNEVIKQDIELFKYRTKIVMGFLFENELFNDLSDINRFACVYYLYQRAIFNSLTTYKDILGYIENMIESYDIKDLLEISHKRVKEFMKLSIKLDKRLICDLIF